MHAPMYRKSSRKHGLLSHVLGFVGFFSKSSAIKRIVLPSNSSCSPFGTWHLVTRNILRVLLKAICFCIFRVWPWTTNYFEHTCFCVSFKDRMWNSLFTQQTFVLIFHWMKKAQLGAIAPMAMPIPVPFIYYSIYYLSYILSSPKK